MRQITILTFLIMLASISKMSGQYIARLEVKKSNANSETAKTAILVSQSILEANWTRLDSLLDDNFVYRGDGYTFSKNQYIGFMQSMRSAFSNFEMYLDNTVEEGDMVSIRFVSKAVNTGKFMGAPATKKNLEVNGIFMRKIKNGKVMEEWQTTDLLGTMTQIGGGSLFFYAVFVGGFNMKPKLPDRLPNDFLNIGGNAHAFDKMTAKEKKRYLKKYRKDFQQKRRNQA
ncbi:MAG TPA: ester cyclase [Catalimonadaceae bacterium]|nr:ester cyclase [Catalimonadaceae bacterium]HPI11722.1 ester cyclase [Catalimonadaceae bacterium]